MIGADQALNSYIYGWLFPSFLQVATPPKLNVVKALGEHLSRQHSFPKLLAAERAAEWQRQLIDKIDRVLVEWDDLGVPRPFVLSDVENVVISWQHPRYNEFCGPTGPGISGDFCSIYAAVKNSDPKTFLAVCAVFLKVMGCEKIIFTDGSGDEGVDCLGVVMGGCLKSTNIVVQAKTSASLISRNTVLAE